MRASLFYHKPIPQQSITHYNVLLNLQFITTMAAIDIDSGSLSILAEVSSCVNHTLGDANFTRITTTVIDAADQFFHLILRIP